MAWGVAGGRGCHARRYPELVDKLMIVDMSPGSLASPSGSFQSARGVGEAMAALPLAEIESRQHADKLLAASVAEAGVRAFALQNLVPAPKGSAVKWRWRLNLDVLNASGETMSQFKLDAPPRPYVGPTVFLRGTKSEYVIPEVHGPLIQALFPGAAIESIEAGHWLHAEKPKEFIDSVVALMNRTP